VGLFLCALTYKPCRAVLNVAVERVSGVLSLLSSVFEVRASVIPRHFLLLSSLILLFIN
jgi:hypothetical protein